MAGLSAEERKRIEAAIGAAEEKTSGEIFVVVTERSDDYRFIPPLWAALFALTIPLPLIWLTPLSASWIFVIQLAVFGALLVVLEIPSLRLKAVPASVRRERAHRNAQRLFLTYNVHTSEERTGILLFVSLAEHHAEVVADAGIFGKIEPDAWEALVARLVHHLGKGELADGLIAGVEAGGALLAQHFPPHPGVRHTLPNAVVEL